MNVWRYLSESSWARLESDHRLPLTQLQAFEDAAECQVPPLSASILTEADGIESYERVAQLSELGFQQAENNYASCWFMDDHESIAMWDLYIGRDDKRVPLSGVAIGLPYSDLAELVPMEARIGPVRYLRHDDSGSNFQLARPELWPFMKLWGYRHEQEVRILIDRHSAALEIGPDSRWGWLRETDLLDQLTDIRVFHPRVEDQERLLKRIARVVPSRVEVAKSRAFPDIYGSDTDGVGWNMSFNPDRAEMTRSMRETRRLVRGE